MQKYFNVRTYAQYPYTAQSINSLLIGSNEFYNIAKNTAPDLELQWIEAICNCLNIKRQAY